MRVIKAKKIKVGDIISSTGDNVQYLVRNIQDAFSYNGFRLKIYVSIITNRINYTFYAGHDEYLLDSLTPRNKEYRLVHREENMHYIDI